MIHETKLKHFLAMLITLLVGIIYIVVFSKESPKFIGSITLNMIVYFYVFKAIKDLSRIFFKKLTDDLHQAIINSRYSLNMLDVVSGIIAITFVAYWIDNHEWHINNFITFCIAIELTKQLWINSYKLAVKVMLFFTIVDLFWSLIAKFIYPTYLNLSMNGKAHLNFFKLEIPVFFGKRAYFCPSLTV